MVVGGDTVKGQVTCNSANSEDSKIIGLCLLCDLKDKGFSTDLLPNNYTTLTVGVGLGVSGYQRLIFPSSGISTDSIRLDLEATGRAGINITVMNGSVKGAVYNLNSLTTKTITGNRFSVTIPAGAAYDRVEVGIEGVSLLTTVNIYGAMVIYPDPTITSPTICSETSTTLNATPNGGTTLKWYTTLTGGTAITTGVTNTTTQSSYTTPILSSTTIYYLEVSKGTCSNSKRVPVTVTVNPQPMLATIPNKSVCLDQPFDLSTLNPIDTKGTTGGTYVWSKTIGGTPLESTTILPEAGSKTYYVRYSLNGCISDQTATITGVSAPALVVSPLATSISLGSGPITLNAQSAGSTLQWYDQKGLPIGAPIANQASINTETFSKTGTYNYYVVANNGTCTTTSVVTITVYSASECPTFNPRVYASSQTTGSIITGSVSSANNAVDGNLQSKSTITTGLGLLGIGTTWQNLIWDTRVKAGTPATIKFSPSTTLLAVGSGISVIGFKKNGNILTDIGTAQSVTGNLLSLLPGDNVSEFTFIPSDITGAKDYDGIRIILGSLVSVAENLDVYEAYHPAVETTSGIDCSKGDVIDVLYGVVPLIGVGAITTTIGVDKPMDAVDNNLNTYATMYSGIGVLAYAKEHIIFSSPSLPGDSLKIITSSNGGLLSLNLLTGFTIQRYLGITPVGIPINNTSTFLSLKLFDNGTRASIILAPMPEPYDRIEIRLGGVASVLASINIYEVQRVTTTKIIGSDINNSITICPGGTLQITPTDACTKFYWFDSDGNLLPGGPSTSLTPTFTSGTHIYYIQPERFGCRLLQRGIVTVTINDLVTKSDAGPDQFLCSGTTTSLSGNAPVVGTGLWTIKSKPVGSNPIITTPTNLNSGVTGLGIGSTVFTWTITNATCTPSLDDVTIMVSTPPTTPTVTPTTSIICSGEIAPIIVTNPDVEGVIYNWYTTPTGGEIVGTGKNFGPVVTATTTFYVEAYNTLTKCISPSRKSITITVVPVPTVPLISATSLAICKGSAAGLSITTPQTGITYNWYDAATDGILLHTGTDYSPTPLQTTTYYIEATNGTCSSPSRASVTVTVNPLPTISIVDGTMSCIGSATSLLNYTTTTGSQLKYSIIWNTTGFSNVPETTLPASPIHLTIPFDAPLGSHTGTLTLKDGITGCTSTYPISVEVKPRIPSPTISIQ